ncbi:MAG: hypothetical protein SFX73_04115 [Kofleriaceae bacterium]|nr:hypothetical protein [Kofleriaceae bacterium]
MHALQTCTTCGARLTWRGAPVIECEYCHTKIQAPPSILLAPNPAARSGGRGGWMFMIGLTAILVTVGVIKGRASRSTTTISTTTVSSTSVSNTVSVKVEKPSAPAPAKPAPVGTQVLRFGEAGTNAGQLSNARALAVTPHGEIVVAEASTGRVQVFDAKGAYQRLITLPPSALTKELTVFGAGAGPTGEVVVSRAGDLLVLDVTGGKVAKTIRGSYPDVFFHGDVEVVPDGSIHAITDRTGDLDVVHVSPAGKILGKVAKVNADHVAVDGVGTMFLTKRFDGVVDVRDAKGEVARKFSQGNPARGKLYHPGPIATDGRGHVFVAESSRVLIFDVEGAFLGELEVGAIQDLAVDREGKLYVLASDHVKKYDLALPAKSR